ncbi:MAG: apolipoprotein N-acyltransferase, partial [Sphingomicrobium sp.]
VLLSLYLALFPALATGLAWRAGQSNRVVMVLVLGGAWILTEWLRATMFTGFPWNPAAAALAPTPLITIGALTGTYGLSGLVVLLGGAVWLEYYRQWLPLVLIVAATVFLWLLPAAPVPEDPLTVMKIRVVQPNLGQETKWREGYDAEAARRLAGLSGRATQEPRLLLWPEAAVTAPLQDSRPAAAAATNAERVRATASLGPNDRLITGGLGVQSADGLGVDSATNSIFILAPGGAILGRYDKAHLVPYGEYLPMRPLLSSIGLARLAPGTMDFAPGPGPRTFELGGQWGRVGLQLCYEIVFSGRVVDNSHRPSFIFNPSNDAWFGRWGPPQHLAQARLRAAEEGLPVIRSTPTGISAVIDAKGNVVKQIGWHKAGVIDTIIPPAAPAATPFSRFGNFIPVLLGLLLIAGGIVLGRRRR